MPTCGVNKPEERRSILNSEEGEGEKEDEDVEVVVVGVTGIKGFK